MLDTKSTQFIDFDRFDITTISKYSELHTMYHSYMIDLVSEDITTQINLKSNEIKELIKNKNNKIDTDAKYHLYSSALSFTGDNDAIVLQILHHVFIPYNKYHKLTYNKITKKYFVKGIDSNSFINEDNDKLLVTAPDNTTKYVLCIHPVQKPNVLTNTKAINVYWLANMPFDP
jgi:hypothetical protein